VYDSSVTNEGVFQGCRRYHNIPHTVSALGPNFTWLSCLRIQLFHHGEIAGLADLTGQIRDPNDGIMNSPRIEEGDSKITVL